MSGEIGGNNNAEQAMSISPPKCVYSRELIGTSPDLDVKQIKIPSLTTIFEVDAMGNDNGELEEEDFIIALTKSRNNLFRDKLEKYYIEFAEKNLGKQKEVGNYLVTELDIPTFQQGVINRKKIIKDKESGLLKMYSETSIEEIDGITTVKTNRVRTSGAGGSYTQHNVEFQYCKDALENYVINEATDKDGNRITHFSSIPEIRSLSEDERTEEQKNLLSEFDNFVQSSIDAGIDYGMDPKFIVSIIQQEVGFKGLSEKVVRTFGKGYMQLTSAPIKDFLGYAPDGKYYDLKVSKYGPEMEELLISRGFDTSSAGTTLAKSKVYDDVFNYLKKNEDPDFNIRLGTLVLRYYTDKAKGDVKSAARYYNGSPLKETYAKNVSKFNDLLAQTVPQDTTYLCRKIKL